MRITRLCIACLNGWGSQMVRYGMVAFAAMLAIGLSGLPVAARAGHVSVHTGGGRSSSRLYYGGGHHTASHGGHFANGSGSSHRGGHYHNPSTGNHYGRHK